MWHFAHVRSTAVLGRDVSIGKDVYVDGDVTIDDGARIQNGVSVYRGVHVGRWCFVGPYVVFTNDLTPRVGNRAWKVIDTYLEVGSSLGAGVIVKCGITIGAFSMAGAGAIVTRSVPPFHLAVGFPAKIREKICACGQTFLPLTTEPREYIRGCCRELMHPEVLGAAESVVEHLLITGI